LKTYGCSGSARSLSCLNPSIFGETAWVWTVS